MREATRELEGRGILKVLGGHFKTGQSWTGQNRPVERRPKHEVSTAFDRD
jgi:hypothetical protein